ncbi:MAG: DegT/DnrJ/EryC1/StrS family aminotransferase [Candidatus Omnitrophica bacterium]|nr:DegT/DnrJ/EryC1/StrS family aminotransferase [Candidatus Omnitrophota bacterium]
MQTELRQIPFGKPIIDEDERNAVNEVLKGPILVHGPKAKEFEAGFAKFTGAPALTSVSSCTAGLHLSYFYLGLKAGDEVIVPAQTHVATAHAVELCGAKPVFVDAEKETGNIDISQIESKITSRTRAISIVHFLGMPVNMEAINAIAKKKNLFVVEDCALAIGTRFRGIHAGLLGDVGCFSFYPVKHMTTAEGGMLITRHPEIALKIQRQKAFGVDRTVEERTVPGVYDVTMLGFNYRLNELAAAMGIEQLKKIDGFLSRRKENYHVLERGLSEIKEISLLKSTHGDYESSYYCLSIILNQTLAAKRFEIVTALKQLGVGTSVYYPHPVPGLKYYREKYGLSQEDFPVASSISDQSIALPVGPHLGADDMAYISNSLKKVLTEVR